MSTSLTADSFPGIISQRMSADSILLSARWLERLKELVPVAANEVFPSEQLLDHIPVLIDAIARYLGAPAEEEIAANSLVIDKARELGLLRHGQQASVHQILREFEILGEILETFVVEEADRLALSPAPSECFDTLRGITRATRSLLRTTVDTFIAEYTATIQERNERLRLFNRMASHELRTPLGTLLFAAAALDQPSVRDDPERLGKVADAIRGNTQRLARLVEGLQRIVFAESADGPHLQQVEVGMIASEVARQLDEMAAAKGVAIRVADELPQIVIDPARLELVLMNLVSNAIKYSDPNKPEPFVEIAQVPGDRDDRVTLTVRDNGLGVPQELLATIFERFSRAHAHLDTELGVSGSGLGLAIVAECLEAIGGTITCESAIGQGTSFRIELPVEPPSAPAALAEA